MLLTWDQFHDRHARAQIAAAPKSERTRMYAEVDIASPPLPPEASGPSRFLKPLTLIPSESTTLELLDRLLADGKIRCHDVGPRIGDGTYFALQDAVMTIVTAARERKSEKAFALVCAHDASRSILHQVRESYIVNAGSWLEGGQDDGKGPNFAAGVTTEAVEVVLRAVAATSTTSYDYETAAFRVTASMEVRPGYATIVDVRDHQELEPLSARDALLLRLVMEWARPHGTRMVLFEDRPNIRSSYRCLAKELLLPLDKLGSTATMRMIARQKALSTLRTWLVAEGFTAGFAEERAD